MKKLFLIVFVVILLLSFAACTAGPNELVKTADPDGKVAGFLHGLWHGFIALFTFIISLFSDNVGVYETHNNGAWYNFGFILGVMIFFGGGGSAGKRARSRN